MAFNIPSIAGQDDPLLGFRFAVSFLGSSGVDFPLDFRFQSVSGFSVAVEVNKVGGAGNNKTGLPLPQRLEYPNLILKRGMPLASALRQEIMDNFDDFEFRLRNVLLSLLDESGQPASTWLFQDAYVTRWSLSGVDATASGVVIEEMELSYLNFKNFSL